MSNRSTRAGLKRSIQQAALSLPGLKKALVDLVDTLGLKSEVTGNDADILALGAALTTEAGAGFTGGTGTIYQSSISKQGGIITTRILLDLTGLTSADSDLDVIGVEDTASVCHIGQITAADCGTVFGGTIKCLETPSSLTDIDFYAAALGTYVYEDLITDDASEVAIVTKGGAWSAGDETVMTGLPAADEYLYVCNGAADTPDIFTAGKFLLQFYGYDA